MNENEQNGTWVAHIQNGGSCLGTGAGCDQCYNADGSCACAPGTQPWGCAAGQNPMCKSVDEINEEKK